MRVCSGSTIHRKDSKWSWLVCLCATLSNTLHMGIANSFAVVMPVLLERFNESKGRGGWLGSIAVTMTFLPTPLAGIVCGRLGCRLTSMMGAVTCALGLVLTSFCESLLLMYLTYGFLFGLGACFIHTGCVFAVTMYFNKRRSLATGIMGASQSLGIITLAPVLQELLHSLGWRNTYRILGALFSLALIAAFSFDPNVEDSEKTVIKSHRVTNENNGMADNQRVTDNKLADSNKVTKQEVDKEKPKFSCEMFKRPAYILALVCVLLGCFGGLVTFVHLVKHCEEMGVAAPQAANLFIFIGISSLISSVVSGRVLDFRRMSPFYVNQFANTVLASSLLLLPQARVYWHFVLFAVFFGLGFGSFITTIYLLLLNTVEPRLRLYSFPVGEAIISAGTLGGAPLAGFIADVTGSYEPAFYTFGGILAFAALLAFPVYFFGLHNVNRDPASTVGGLHEVEVNEALELEREKNGIGNKATEEDSSDDNKNGNKTETWAEIELTSTNCQSVENDGNDNVAFDISEESTKL